jgi:acyl carrier protein
MFPDRIPTVSTLGETLARHGVTTLWLTSSLFNLVIDEGPENLVNLGQLLVGGEALSIGHVRRALELLPRTRLINGYGPTEGTTFTCCYTIRELPGHARSVPIGKPVSNTRVHVLDERLKALPVGVPGELYIGGDGLARGYLNQPELTAERFVHDPFNPGNGARLYRTGDLCRYLPDGSIQFLGRKDDQVKLRGFRIEPGDVECALRNCHGVRDCAVVVRVEAPGEKRLVAYLIPEDAHNVPRVEDLRETLTGNLPGYMIPSAFLMLERLPRTPNGKIDRAALPAPDASPSATGEQYVGPRTPLEETVAAIWKEVLKVDTVGVHDNFFELGGHSLKAVQLLAHLKLATGTSMSMLDFFKHQTVAGMVTAMSKPQLFAAPEANRSFIVPLREEGSRSPLFIIPGGWGEANELLTFAALIRLLDRGRPVYGIRSRTMDTEWKVPATAREQAQAIFKTIREVQPRGPYLFLGECIASSMAMELARLADEEGEPPGTLIFLDGLPPPRKETLRSYLLKQFGLRTAKKSAPKLYTGELPPSVAEYYRMLSLWKPLRVRSKLHLLLSSRMKAPASIARRWKPFFKNKPRFYTLCGDHDTYIREQSAETATVINRILRGINHD